MGKKHRLFSIWYFIAAFLIILMIQNYFAGRHVEAISYSQFKFLLTEGLITDVAIGEKSIEGNMKEEAVKEILATERLKNIHQDVKEGRNTYPFTTVRVEDPGLTAELEEARVSFRALLAARQGKDSVEMADFDEAIERVVAGLQRKSHVMSPKEKRIVAYHESGHALLAELVAGADPVSKISIIPGESLPWVTRPNCRQKIAIS